MKKFLLCTVAAAGLALASPAFAAPVVVEDLGSDPNTGISFTPGAGTFDDAFTFSVDAPETLTIAARSSIPIRWASGRQLSSPTSLVRS